MTIRTNPKMEDIQELRRSDGIIGGLYDGKRLVLFPEGTNCFYDGNLLSPMTAMSLYQEINRLIDMQREKEAKGVDIKVERIEADPLPKAEVGRPGFFWNLFGRRK